MGGGCHCGEKGSVVGPLGRSWSWHGPPMKLASVHSGGGVGDEEVSQWKAGLTLSRDDCGVDGQRMTKANDSRFTDHMYRGCAYINAYRPNIHLYSLSF